MVADAQKKCLNGSLNLQLHGGTKREGHLDLDGLCQASQVYKSHGLKNTLQTPAGSIHGHITFHDTFTTWGYRCLVGKGRAGSLQGGRVGLKTLHLLQQIQLVLLKLPEDPEDFRLVLFVFLLSYPWKCAKPNGCYLIFFLCSQITVIIGNQETCIIHQRLLPSTHL